MRRVEDASGILSKQTQRLIFPPVWLYNSPLLEVKPPSADSATTFQENIFLKKKKNKIKSHKTRGATRECEESLKDCRLLWGRVSKSGRRRQRWFEMRCVGGRVAAWTDETDQLVFGSHSQRQRKDLCVWGCASRVLKQPAEWEITGWRERRHWIFADYWQRLTLKEPCVEILV